MNKYIFAFLAIMQIAIQLVSAGIIRDQESLQLGGERISKRSIDDNDNQASIAEKPLPTPSAAKDVESQAVVEDADVIVEKVERRIIYKRSIRSDESHHHDDLLLNIVPKAIFGERILKKFVEERAFASFETAHNVVFKPQFRIRSSTFERRTIE